MPPHHHRHADSLSEGPSPPKLVDLASPPSHNMAPKRKRSVAEAADEDARKDTSSSSSKRPRRAAATNSTTSSRKSSGVDIDTMLIDEVDLVHEQQNAQDRLRQEQLAEQVKAQQGEAERDKPLKLSNLQCVICLEAPTDLTATTCGHLFCHHCLMEALIAGENRAARAGETRKSQCPVCRKNLSRTKRGAQDIIPLLMKKGISSQPRRKAAKG